MPYPENLEVARTMEKAVRGEGAIPATIFLLVRGAELTEGRSLYANLSLLVNNARVGGRIASAMASIA